MGNWSSVDESDQCEDLSEATHQQMNYVYKDRKTLAPNWSLERELTGEHLVDKPWFIEINCFYKAAGCHTFLGISLGRAEECYMS